MVQTAFQNSDSSYLMSCKYFGLTSDGGTNSLSSSITLFSKIVCVALYQIKAAVYQTII